MTRDDFPTRQVVSAASLGREPLPPVSVHEHMVFGAGMTDALDYLVLLHCMFLAASNRPFTVNDVIASLRQEGIKSSNGSGLVGRDAVRASFRGLIEAGFIRRIQSNEKGKFGKAEYELFQHPSYNPARTAPHASEAAKPQVTPQTAMPSPVIPATATPATATAINPQVTPQTAMPSTDMPPPPLPPIGRRRIPPPQTPHPQQRPRRSHRLCGFRPRASSSRSCPGSGPAAAKRSACWLPCSLRPLTPRDGRWTLLWPRI